MGSNVIRILCPNLSCRRILAVPLTARGKIVRCRECGTNVRIPANADPQPQAAPPPTDEPDEAAA